MAGNGGHTLNLIGHKIRNLSNKVDDILPIFASTVLTTIIGANFITDKTNVQTALEELDTELSLKADTAGLNTEIQVNINGVIDTDSLFVFDHVDNMLGVGINSPTAVVHAAGGDSTRAALRLEFQSAPISPNDGDLWFRGTDLFGRIDGITYIFNKTVAPIGIGDMEIGTTFIIA